MGSPWGRQCATASATGRSSWLTTLPRASSSYTSSTPPSTPRSVVCGVPWWPLRTRCALKAWPPASSPPSATSTFVGGWPTPCGRPKACPASSSGGDPSCWACVLSPSTCVSSTPSCPARCNHSSTLTSPITTSRCSGPQPTPETGNAVVEEKGRSCIVKLFGPSYADHVTNYDVINWSDKNGFKFSSSFKV